MKERILQSFTYLIFALVFISCIISLGNNNIYQDGEWANAQWLGQDLISLFLAAPLLLISYYKGFKRRKAKWVVVYSACLMYFAYAYAFFVFAAKLTFLYMFHLPIFGLASIGLGVSLLWLFGVSQNFTIQSRSILLVAAGYLLLISLMLTFLWASDIISHLLYPEYFLALLWCIIGLIGSLVSILFLRELDQVTGS